MTIEDKIKSRLLAITVGCVTTLWDLLVWRVSETHWVVGHQSVRLSDPAISLEDAVVKFERLLD